MSGTSDVRRVVLSSDTLRVAEEIRDLCGPDSIEDAIRVALGDELYFQKKLRDNFRVLVNRGDDSWKVDLKSSR